MKTEVVVIGGGATGAGVFRDLALRGLEVVLLEKGDLTSGTSGRNHGLLHSGARYAVYDPDSARECFQENVLIKKIAAPCLEETGGFFLSLPEDPPKYADTLLRACHRLGIPAQEVAVADVLHQEAKLSPKVKRAIWVPDASVDPFRLIRANIEAGESLGGRVFLHRQVVDIFAERGQVRGVKVIDPRTGEEFKIQCRFLINAAGVWAGEIARLAGINLGILFSKGSLVVFNQRLVNTVINRCRPPANGDIFVPHGPTLILGTTSQTVAQVEDLFPEIEEVDLLLREGEKIIPQAKETRVIRAYAGIRPLLGAREAEREVQGESGTDGRRLSRDFLLVNHGEHDQLRGFFSIIGGKLTTYRLMAEKTVDAVMDEIGRKESCRTAEIPLPFPREYSFHALEKKLLKIAQTPSANVSWEIICECELVSKKEILQEVGKLEIFSLKELQERTRAGMGPCQGGFCAPRLTALLLETGKITAGEALTILKNFLEERWKGIRPVLWGPQLREEQLIQALYTEFFNLDRF
ncbi:MAG: anaerobic glycerol-3-phosphate dehydrogenase subunit GlpA [Thermodesulfobacteriota bacterium]